MAQTRTYEVIQEIESAGLPPLAPVKVGAPLTNQDAVNLEYLTNAGLDPKATLSPVADLTALKAITGASRIDGSLALKLDTRQLYAYAQSSTETANDRNVVLPNDSTGRWIEIRAKRYVRFITANYTIKDEDEFIIASGLAGDITLTLPSATNKMGVVYNIKNSDSTYKVTISGGTIDGQASFILKDQYHSIDIVTDGTNWYVLKEYLKTIPNDRFSNFGDRDTNGSWRVEVSGTSLLFQRRESAVWVTKHEMEA